MTPNEARSFGSLALLCFASEKPIPHWHSVLGLMPATAGVLDSIQPLATAATLLKGLNRISKLRMPRSFPLAHLWAVCFLESPETREACLLQSRCCRVVSLDVIPKCSPQASSRSRQAESFPTHAVRLLHVVQHVAIVHPPHPLQCTSRCCRGQSSRLVLPLATSVARS